MRGSYPRLYREISRMAEKRALETKVARSIMRKADVRLGGDADSSSPGLTTLVDATIDPSYPVHTWQWAVDLSPYTHIRFTCAAQNIVYLWYSGDDGSPAGDLTPADYQQMLCEMDMALVNPFDPPTGGPFGPPGGPYYVASSSNINSVDSFDLYWFFLTDAQRAPVRLSVSDSPSTLTMEASSYEDADTRGFSVAVQVM